MLKINYHQTIFLLMLSFILLSPRISNAKTPTGLNVLLITVDDMNWDSLGVTGCKTPDITPNIDKLASEGMLFHKAHVTIAVCQPTRAVWMTGQYPHNNGALGFERINKKTTTLIQLLKKAGYFNGVAGKETHVTPSRRRLWDKVIAYKQLQKGRSPELYFQETKSFLADAKQAKKPFFLMVNSHDPHRPFAGSAQEEQHMKVRQRFNKNIKTNKQQKILPFPVEANPYKLKDVEVPGFLPDIPKVRKEIAEYYTSVRRADKTVGAVLRALKESGQADKTLVIFMSDHGMALPFAKTNCYYHSTKTPMIVRLPGKIKAGSEDKKHFVHGIDITPTILDALGLPAKKEVDGESFLPLLIGMPCEERKSMMTVFHQTAGKKKFEMRAVHVNKYYYIRNFWSDGKMVFKNESQSGLTMRAMVMAGMKDPAIQKRVDLFKYRLPEELYDYENDPDALHNLASDPTHQKRLQHLREELLKQMTKYNDPFKDQFAQELKGR